MFRSPSPLGKSVKFRTISLLSARVGSLTLVLSVLIAGSALAQSGTGLKLGAPTEPASTLDLGAAPAAPAAPAAEPAADKTAPPANPATSKGTPGKPTRITYGAWEVACGPGGKNCAMAQIGNDSKGTPVLEMVVRKLDEPLEVGERTAIAVLDVITPLGVVLTEGLTVTIDSGRNESAPFQICTEQGCLVREPIDSDLVNRFKRGNKTTISVIAANQGEVKATLSLSGFTKAFGSLK
jgi:invasion protein IalB